MAIKWKTKIGLMSGKAPRLFGQFSPQPSLRLDTPELQFAKNGKGL